MYMYLYLRYLNEVSIRFENNPYTYPETHIWSLFAPFHMHIRLVSTGKLCQVVVINSYYDREGLLQARFVCHRTVCDRSGIPRSGSSPNINILIYVDIYT